ncbi:MAG: hypothetical protein KGJ40_02735 [candidate division NC10 bacterium]|nr:hypothetical protein [candidate division NC10 bacterium]
MDLDRLEKRRLPRFSWDYQHLPEPPHWFLMARAYLDCSHHLFAEMIQGRLSSSFHHAKVAVGTFEHALELFLKGAIAQAHRPVQAHHRATDLLREYRRFYPGKEFEFTDKIDEAVSEQSSAPRNQYARYPVDPKGHPWEGNTHIDLSIWYQELRLFKADFERLEPLIKARYP